MNGTKAIKVFFQEGEHGRPVNAKELLALSKEERVEMGRLCCEALGEEYEAPVS